MGDTDAATIADAAIARLFERIGIDASDRAELRKLGRDLFFLRSMREAAEDREELLRRETVTRPGKVAWALFERVLTFAGGVALALAIAKWGIR